MATMTVSERLDLLKKIPRPSINDYIPLLFQDFIEFHGDRYFADDSAVKGGIAEFKGRPITVIAQVKGRDIEELQKTNFAMPHPEGYRKALRLAKQAEKFHRPVICFIDTPGAFCGVGAEERGQGEAIARNLLEFMDLKTPVVSIVLGEGGSGGALALGVCDKLAMLENALYSVISPRGFASILWKDASREREAAELMKITAEDLKSYGVCDVILSEPEGGAKMDVAGMAGRIAAFIDASLSELVPVSVDSLLENRYMKYRKIGAFES
ncbi:MAG: acetyl-CoA carboxylase carboxyltransferase subunit alpha [Treponema sp.]|jgi:acetyl-CoA carboxylase carboxyl transferase subunit alpha|nr:acetyl-CoA carboxylase carboxyltransferase subunit alpha [Treponema sp.]